MGGDAEFSAGRVLVRGEAIRSSWAMPAIAAPMIEGPLVATSFLLEGRYKIAPGAYVAARADRLDFSTLSTTRGPQTWDSNVWRIEAGGGYSIMRNIQIKGAWQRNHRDGGRVRGDTMMTAQVLYWF